MESLSCPVPPFSLLLVEDEVIALEFLAIILTRKYPDLALHTAINGRTGLELFKTHLPDIAITDINMPEMGGVQLIDKIRAIKPDTKIIVFTGASGKLPLKTSAGKGCNFDHFIMKPVVFQELFSAIEQCFGEIAHHGVVSENGSQER